MHFKRIMIFGNPGSGKSTCAQRLAKKLGLSLYHTDALYYTSGWQERPRKDFDADVCAITKQDAYIIDGNCARLLLDYDLSVDLVIYLDVPLYTCYWRVFKRRFTKDKTLNDRAPDCPERITWQFLYKMWKYKNRQEPRLLLCYFKYTNTRFIHIKSDEAQ